MFKALKRILHLLGRRGTLQVGGLSLVLLSGTALQFLPIVVVLPIIRLITRPGEPLSPRLLEVIPEGWHEPINHILTQTDYQTLVISMVLFAVVVTLVEGFVSIGLNNLNHFFLFRKKLALAKKMFRRYLATPRISHRDPVNDIEFGSQSLGAILGGALGLFQNGVLFLASFAAIVFLFPLPGLAGFVFLIVTAVLLFLVINPFLAAFGEEKIRALEKKRFGLSDEMMAVKEIKVLGREKHFYDSFVENATIRERNNRIRDTVGHSSTTLFASLRFLSLLAGFFVALWQGLPSTALVSFLFAYTIVVMRAGGYLGSILGIMINIKTQVSRFNLSYDTMEKLNEEHEMETDEMLDFDESIELKEASFRYDTERDIVLDRLNLRIGKGECIGIIGKNGCGKTTLIDLLTGLARPTGGSLLIDGLELTGACLRSWQRRIGYVVQNPHIIDNTILANITLGLNPDEVDRERLREAVETSKLDEIIRQLPDGMDTVVGQKGSKLSGGQAQRLGIARALYRDVDVIVLDEATKSIDPQTEAEIIGNITRMKKEKTIIMVTHKLQTLQQCDRIYMLEGGRVGRQGTYREVVEDDRQLRHDIESARKPPGAAAGSGAGAAPEVA
ncbi:MAG: ATP-binding cassette domain-containing protein [Gammaproteobacteria bacterium]|nr:ATP-binding cassette domain-containing protein [Gammaproteobacteria bacterium]